MEIMSTEETVRVLLEAWKLMAGRFPDANIEHAENVATMFANLPLPFLNISMPDRPLPDERTLRAALTVIKDRAKSCKHESLVALCEPWAPPEWERIAAEEGFALALNMTGMATDRLLPPRRPLPQLQFRRVADETTARDLAMINGQAYKMSLDLFECMCNLYLWQPDTFGYIGHAAGKALTCAAVLPVAGTIYVAFVATLPEEHGKGYAEAVMRHAIEQGRGAMGLNRMTLHASDMGRPVYSAMGFQPGARVVLLNPPA
jgi:GNAT superfamily N-acetyltransferase